MLWKKYGASAANKGIFDYRNIMSIKGKVMAFFNKFNIKEITGIQTALTPEMAAHIELWNDMLQGKASWTTEENIKPSGVVEAIAGALTDPVSEEMDVSAPENEILDKAIKSLNEKSTEIVQNMALCGGCIVRPVFANGKLQFEIIRLGNYIPTAYDFDGTLIAAIILKQFDEKNKHYLLIERHEYKNRNHSINMELYEIVNAGTLKRVDLTACSTTENLTVTTVWENVDRPFIIEFRNRKPNKIDCSNVPCAIYAGNENLIEDADRQYNRMNWEQESGERKIFADADLFKKKQTKDAQGNKIVSFTDKISKLFVKVNSSGINEEKITPFNPELRTTQQNEAFQQILRRIELACNIGKGTLSDMESVAQTATQYTGGKKALYTMIDTIESELEEKYKSCAYVFAYIGAVYIGGLNNSDIEISFNDTARKDPIAMKQEALQEMNAGVLNKWEYRNRFYGEDEETAKLNTPETETGSFVL